LAYTLQNTSCQRLTLSLYKGKLKIWGRRICMAIGVIGSITKDRIIIDKTRDEFEQVGGTVYYSSITLTNLGSSVISIPLLAEQNSYLLKHLIHKNITCYPGWTDKTTVYENRYPSDSQDVCERTIMENAVEGYNLEGSGKYVSMFAAKKLAYLGAIRNKNETNY